MANEELGPALRLQEKTQADAVEKRPRRRVRKMQGQRRTVRQDRETGRDRYVAYQQH